LYIASKDESDKSILYIEPASSPFTVLSHLQKNKITEILTMLKSHAVEINKSMIEDFKPVKDNLKTSKTKNLNSLFEE
jgi:hypothetical protein